MRNRWPALLGIILVGLWIVGLTSTDSRTWLAWVDGVLGVASLVISGAIPTYMSRQSRMAILLTFAAVALVVGVMGVVTEGPVWQGWWTFACGCIYLMMGVSSAVERVPPGVMTEEERARMERDRIEQNIKKSA